MEYKQRENKVNNFTNHFTTHYGTFLSAYKQYLYQSDKSFFTKNKFNSLMNNNSNIKKLVNANTKSQLNLELAQYKAIENAKIEKAKAIEIAKLQKAEANRKLKQNANNKCTAEWKEYNKYKENHPWTYKIRGPKRPDCNENLRNSKNNLTKDRSRSSTLTVNNYPNQ